MALQHTRRCHCKSRPRFRPCRRHKGCRATCWRLERTGLRGWHPRCTATLPHTSTLEKGTSCWHTGLPLRTCRWPDTHRGRSMRCDHRTAFPAGAGGTCCGMFIQAQTQAQNRHDSRIYVRLHLSKTSGPNLSCLPITKSKRAIKDTLKGEKKREKEMR